jgi:hypothetical protein
MSWLAFDNPSEVIPLQDLKPHNSGEHCGCRPEWDEGILIHNAFDGREAFERGERRPS